MIRVLDSADSTLVEWGRQQHADEPFWTTELGQDGPQTPTADGIKSLCEIHKQYVEVLVLLAALLLYLAYREDHVYCFPVTPEARGWPVSNMATH